MFTTGLDIDYERVVNDLHAAVAGVTHALKSPNWAIRKAAMKAATDNLDAAVKQVKEVDLSK